MPQSNTVLGKAFEFATLDAFNNALRKESIEVLLDEGDAFRTAKNSFEALTQEQQLDYMKAANAAVELILPVEPRLNHPDGGGSLLLRIQTDAQGQAGDVRDIVCIRSNVGWEIGISCKHNHEALKHPRVTSDADFGSDWIGYPCSGEFLSRVNDTLEIVKSRVGHNWRDYEDTHDVIYVPIIQAYIDEIRRLCDAHTDAPAKLVGYFFGVDDFYKVITKDRRRRGTAGTTTVMAFNINGTLGQSSRDHSPLRPVRRTSLPDELISISFKRQSKTTLIMTFDKGWQISMRLHNADSKVKATGLKWDITLVGMPAGMYKRDVLWM